MERGTPAGEYQPAFQPAGLDTALQWAVDAIKVGHWMPMRDLLADTGTSWAPRTSHSQVLGSAAAGTHVVRQRLDEEPGSGDTLMMHARVSAELVLRAYRPQGADVCSYLPATDLDMRPLYGFALTSWETGFGDIFLQPDLTAWWPVTGAHRTDGDTSRDIREVIVLADAHHLQASPVEVSPRQVLRRQLQRLEFSWGLTAKAGLECEFTVFRGPQDDAVHTLRPLGTYSGDYALHHPLHQGQFLRELEDGLTGAGLPREAVKTEADPGQKEVTFRYGPAMAAADHHTLFKHLARQTADWTQKTATFMAAPTTATSNGLHLHLSLWRQGHPALSHNGGDTLSETGQHALHSQSDGWYSLVALRLAGLLRHRVVCTMYESRAGDRSLGAHDDEWDGVIVRCGEQSPGGSGRPAAIRTTCSPVQGTCCCFPVASSTR
ncbi:hypothetical protein OG552_28480 [Streptomyces sp. NBC_01476]|uniref:hypothetical protein n=1 Tax=Streptomyces sp. NBC_01476 TaxID=2903881 RepID=UPI002E2F93F7|nr:hypothetical protein [Streptomyces sp. NBC_01476]